MKNQYPIQNPCPYYFSETYINPTTCYFAVLQPYVIMLIDHFMHNDLSYAVIRLFLCSRKFSFARPFVKQSAN